MPATAAKSACLVLRCVLPPSGGTPESLPRRGKALKAQSGRQDSELTEPDSDDDSLLGDDPTDLPALQIVGRALSCCHQLFCIHQGTPMLPSRNSNFLALAFLHDNCYFSTIRLTGRPIAEDPATPDSLTKEELIQRRLGCVKSLFRTYKVCGRGYQFVPEKVLSLFSFAPNMSINRIFKKTSWTFLQALQCSTYWQRLLS